MHVLRGGTRARGYRACRGYRAGSLVWLGWDRMGWIPRWQVGGFVPFSGRSVGLSGGWVHMSAWA